MQVERDYPNLRVAALESFEEGWAFSRAERTLQKNAVRDPVAFVQKVVGKRTLAEGYYEWVRYLRWLSNMHEIVVFHDLLAIEVEGIRIVRDARDEFFRNHPGCYKCGALNDKFAPRCCECKTELK